MLTDDLWVGTATGAGVHLLSTDPATIRLMDIAVHLARIPRFNGGAKIGHTVSVATHSILVMQLMPAGTSPVDRLHALLHDAHEAYLGDIITPVERVLSMVSGSEAIAHMKARLQMAIEIAAGIGVPDPLTRIAIRLADREALALEKRDILHADTPPWGLELPDISRNAHKVLGESEAEAIRIFLFNYTKWSTQAAVVPPDSFVVGM